MSSWSQRVVSCRVVERQNNKVQGQSNGVIVRLFWAHRYRVVFCLEGDRVHIIAELLVRRGLALFLMMFKDDCLILERSVPRMMGDLAMAQIPM